MTLTPPCACGERAKPVDTRQWVERFSGSDPVPWVRCCRCGANWKLGRATKAA